jgi:hypothetical protein
MPKHLKMDLMQLHLFRSILILIVKNAASYFHSILRYIAEDEMKELSSHTVGIILHIFYVH